MKKSTGYLIIAVFWFVVLVIAMLSSTKTQAQTQIDNCDSLSWTQYPVAGLSITLDTTGAGTHPYGVDSVEVIWTACNSTQCYSAPMGMTGYFPQVSLSDTLKVCFDAWFYSTALGGNWFWEYCSQCDSIIHDGTSWVLFTTQGNSWECTLLGCVDVGIGLGTYATQLDCESDPNTMCYIISNINEIKPIIGFNKIYDLMGREFKSEVGDLPKGLYIINNKKVVIIK
jgi:hypothetical protein